MPAKSELNSLFHGKRMFCPHCEIWAPVEEYTRLIDAPPEYRHLTTPIVKHSGRSGCKMLVAPIIK